MTSNPINVAIVNESVIITEGLKTMLCGIDDIHICGVFNDGSLLMDNFPVTRPHIIITDFHGTKMKGTELTKILRNKYPSIKVLIFSIFTNEDYIFDAIKAGAKGFITKNTSRKELLTALYSIRNGYDYFTKSISDIILKSYIRQVKEEDALSQREIEIMKLVTEGYNNKDIAEKLFLSSRTIESHKNHIMKKLKLRNTIDLVRFAVKKGLIEL